MRTPRTPALLIGAALPAGALTAPPAHAEAPDRARAATPAAAPRPATAANFRDLGGDGTGGASAERGLLSGDRKSVV